MMKPKITFSKLRSEQQNRVNALINEVGAFFAFSQKDYDEQKQEGVEYVNYIAGMVIPKQNLGMFKKKYDRIFNEFVDQYEVISDLDGCIIDILKGRETLNSDELEEALNNVKRKYPGCEKEDILRFYKNSKDIT